MDEKKFEQEYRTWKQQAAPDLWNRIEENLAEHPERKQRPRIHTLWKPVSGVAAAILVLVAAAGVNSGRFGESSAVTEFAQETAAAYRPLSVPQDAVTEPEDSRYFSEAILGDTELLCGGTVTSVSFESDDSGRAVKVVYEIQLDQVYYADDYTTDLTGLTVKSPIIKTEGDEAYVLYQLQQEETYLLPLIRADGGWELLYPFAPQIQVTGDGAYLFHSGYSSLVDSSTQVVAGTREGENDYYFDRMLLREDDNFPLDLVSLIEREAQGRKSG